jgi:hypothetical protein
MLCVPHVGSGTNTLPVHIPDFLGPVPALPAQVAELQEQLQEAQQSIMARDAEVSRLGARLGAGGPDVEALSRDQRGDAYETVILSLNKQVGNSVWREQGL